MIGLITFAVGSAIGLCALGAWTYDGAHRARLPALSRAPYRAEWPAWDALFGNYTSKMGRVQERAAEERQAKLEHIREQVTSGALVIRQMTRAERVRWDEQHAMLEATLTPAERTRRNSLLRQRRERAERLLGNAP